MFIYQLLLFQIQIVCQTRCWFVCVIDVGVIGCVGGDGVKYGIIGKPNAVIISTFYNTEEKIEIDCMVLLKILYFLNKRAELF